MYPVQLIVNTILERAFTDKIPINLIKLQRLLYLFYRDYMGLTKESLFAERFCCWQYGPMLLSVHEYYRDYKDLQLDCYMKAANGDCRNLNLWPDKNALKSFELIVHHYFPLNSIDLSEMTRANGSAWMEAFQTGMTMLDDHHIMKEALAVKK